jgi:hypothetical protein
VPANFDQRPREEYVRAAWSAHPEVLAAEEAVQKARAGVNVAKSAYLPDITAYGRHSYQDGVPFLVRNFGTFGVHLEWDVFDFGRRRAAVRAREAQLAQAEENLRRLKEEVEVGIERSYNKLERTRGLVQVANQVVKLRQEGERLAGNQLTQGVLLVSERRQAQRGNLQGAGGLSPGEPGLPACMGRTGAGYGTNPRILGPFTWGGVNALFPPNPQLVQPVLKDVQRLLFRRTHTLLYASTVTNLDLQHCLRLEMLVCVQNHRIAEGGDFNQTLPSDLVLNLPGK